RRGLARGDGYARSVGPRRRVGPCAVRGSGAGRRAGLGPRRGSGAAPPAAGRVAGAGGSLELPRVTHRNGTAGRGCNLDRHPRTPRTVGEPAHGPPARATGPRPRADDGAARGGQAAAGRPTPEPTRRARDAPPARAPAPRGPA